MGGVRIAIDEVVVVFRRFRTKNYEWYFVFLVDLCKRRVLLQHRQQLVELIVIL